MKLLQIFNQYRSLFNGEESVVHRTAELIEKHGGQARLLMRSSRDIGEGLDGKFKAFWSGMYSPGAYRQMQRLLEEERPDIVHAHNLYPLFSPSVLVACRRAGIPVVMSVHNQNLTCPTSDHLYQGRACERCFGGKEYHCVLQNCRGRIVESIGYALRSAVARKFRLFQDNVTLLIALSRFARQRLVWAGFDAEQVEVLPNMVQTHLPAVDPARGAYVAYAGRMSAEKGVATLLDAVSALPNCALQLAGDGPLLERLRGRAPQNTHFRGRLGGSQMQAFYRTARFLVLPSTCFEMCPLVISEAMSHGLPVIASRIGGVNELVDEGVTGLLFKPGDSRDLACKIQYLWDNPQLCRAMGAAGHQKAIRQYGEEVYYRRLIAIYEKALRRCGWVRSQLPQATELSREAVAS